MRGHSATYVLSIADGFMFVGTLRKLTTWASSMLEPKSF